MLQDLERMKHYMGSEEYLNQKAEFESANAENNNHVRHETRMLSILERDSPTVETGTTPSSSSKRTISDVEQNSSKKR